MEEILDCENLLDYEELLDYIFYEFKGLYPEDLYKSNDLKDKKFIKEEVIPKLQAKIQSLDLSFFQEYAEHNSECTMDCFDFWHSPTEHWPKTKREDLESDEDYEYHLQFDNFFLSQEKKLKDEFLSKNNMNEKDWDEFAKKASETCEKCDDIDGKMVCENNCAYYQWGVFADPKRELISKELFETFFKSTAVQFMQVAQKNSLELAQLYTEWKKTEYKEINIIDPACDIEDDEEYKECLEELESFNSFRESKAPKDGIPNKFLKI